MTVPITHVADWMGCFFRTGTTMNSSSLASPGAVLRGLLGQSRPIGVGL